MSRQARWSRLAVRVGLTTTLALVLSLSFTACGQSGHTSPAAKSERALQECRSQWRDVGESVVGMDEDTNPSALADRWTSVIATVDYYKTVDTAKNCPQQVETQLKAVTALREFSEKLRPYDMTYQRDQVQASIDLYLHEPLPQPARADNGKRTPPPSKAAVTAAMRTLTDNAEQANIELQPGWTQTESVDLTDVTALTKTMQDLDFLAQDSPHWVRCEQALQVLVAAIRAQEGLGGSGSATPSSSPSP
jgi:hypothetical protein